MFGGAVTITKEDSNIVIEVKYLSFIIIMRGWHQNFYHYNDLFAFHLQWSADSVNDMYADAVLVMVLQIESNPHGLQSESHDLYHSHMMYLNVTQFYARVH